MVQLIGRSLFDDVARRAAASPRKRLNHNFHSGPADNPHRFLNVLLEGTYVRPHRHSEPPKDETFLVLEGRAEILIFNDAGDITERHELTAGTEATLGVDIPAGAWHTIVALSPKVICFEVKPGPWEPASDKEFAAWAPKEGEPAVESYLNQLCAANSK